jgi:RNA polymerase sigma-70 factor, ECF subfamily
VNAEAPQRSERKRGYPCRVRTSPAPVGLTFAGLQLRCAAVSGGREDVERALPAAVRGDEQGLSVLWRAHQPSLLRYLRGRGLGDAEDVAAQVWIDVARGLPRFRGGADDFRGWLFTIAHRRAVDERRRIARRSGPVEAQRGAEAPGADVEFEARDSLSQALTLVARLPAAMRDVVLLRVVAGLSVAETAEVLELREGNVRVLTHRGLLRLEELLVAADAEVVTLWASSTMKRSR